jgi:NhaP-type Na+/H+ or K+/H+ antiporter
MRLARLLALLASALAVPKFQQGQPHSPLTLRHHTNHATAHANISIRNVNTPQSNSTASHVTKQRVTDDPVTGDQTTDDRGRPAQEQPSQAPEQAAEDSMGEEESEELAFAVFVFPICAILLGLAISGILNKYAPFVPYTPVLLVLGFVCACLQAPKLFSNTHLQPSLEAWQHLSGHLILYVFIPPLIFGDAMQLDFHILKRCAVQCLLLAVPAVIMNTMLTATVAIFVLPSTICLGSWPLAIAFGAVLSATDPVAVVSLLKSLGASPALTMLIGGESLLNDGTAMVLFDIFFSLYMREEQDFVAFLATILFGSLAIGLISGGLLLFVLSLFSNKLKHYNSELQISLTIVAAYANFYFSEAVVGASGILSLVLMGCVCGYGFWPMIVNVEQMRGVWHTLEWLLNTLLFQLTGLIIGYKFMDNEITLEGYGWAAVTYLFLIVIRFAVIFLLLPILARTGYGMSWQGAVVAAWGGLRGALGLALALVMEAQLSHTDFDSRRNKIAGHLIVVHISVVAVLTLLVNAPTTGPLLGALGMLQTPREKEHALEDLRSRMQDFVLARYRAMEAADGAMDDA